MALLAEHRPDDAVLSEEGKDDKVRLTRDRVWIVDPLDGTREFSEPPRDDWAVHVALWQRGGRRGTSPPARSPSPALGQTFNTGAPPVVPPRTAAAAADRGLPHPPAGVRRRRWPRSSTPSWCRWARPAPR